MAMAMAGTEREKETDKGWMNRTGERIGVCVCVCVCISAYGDGDGGGGLVKCVMVSADAA